MATSHFTLRVRIGEQEIEIGGSEEEVMRALEDLEKIITRVSNAFGNRVVQKAVELTSVDTSISSGYPKIPQTPKCSEAIANLLKTEWGKTPKTLFELKKGMEANAIHFPSSTLSGTLNWLVKKGRLRRWKGADKKYQYTLVVEGEE